MYFHIFKPIHLSVDIWVVYVSWVSCNEHGGVAIWDHDYNYFEYTLRSRVTGSYGSSIIYFLRNIHIVYHSGHTSLYSHWQCTRVQNFHSLTNIAVIFWVFKNTIAIPTCVRWYLIVILICISLINSEVEHVFTYWWPFVCLA